MTDVFVIVYAAIVLLAICSAWAILYWRGGLRDRRLAWAMVAVKGVLAAENIYYAIGRLWPDAQGLFWYWPGVLLFKAGFVVALAAVLLQVLRHQERVGK